MKPRDPSKLAQLPPPGQAPAPQAPPAAPPEPVDAQWGCKLSKLDATGTPAGDLPETITVGEKFHIACEGPPAQLKADSMRLDLPKNAKYALRILQTRTLKDDRAEFVATSWTAGAVKLPNPVLTDGKTRIGLGAVQVNVSSVITPENNPEGKPYGEWSPVFLPWPVWVYGLMVFVVAVLVTMIALLVRKSVRRRKLIRLLEKNAIALTPYNQFSKDLRRLSREFPGGPSWNEDFARGYVSFLNESFRWYLARQLVVSAIGTRPREIVNEIRRVDKNLYKDSRKDIYLALSELEKAVGAKNAYAYEDVQQITELCRRLADRISRSRSA